MSFGVRLLLGALAVAGGEDSTHHRSASFWSDLDDGSSVPKGAESTVPSALPRLCSGTTASSYRRCNTGEEGGLLLLEYASRGRSWQRHLEMPYEPQGSSANSFPWLPHWSRLKLFPPST